MVARPRALVGLPLLALMALLVAPSAKGQSETDGGAVSSVLATTQDLPTCQFSLFLFRAIASEADGTIDLGKAEALHNEMLGFCQEFKPGQVNYGNGERCHIRTGANASLPTMSVQIPGCCSGPVARELQQTFPSIMACKAVGEGLEPLKLDVKVVPGAPVAIEVQEATPAPEVEIVETDLRGIPVNDTETVEDGATLKDALSDWRLWLALGLVLLLMLLFCTVCICCLCRRHKKRERDAQYQAERKVKLALSQQSPLRSLLPPDAKEEALDYDESPPNSNLKAGLVVVEDTPEAAQGSSKQLVVVAAPPAKQDPDSREDKSMVVMAAPPSPTIQEDERKLVAAMHPDLEYSDSDDGEQLDRWNSATRRSAFGGGDITPASSRSASSRELTAVEIELPDCSETAVQPFHTASDTEGSSSDSAREDIPVLPAPPSSDTDGAPPPPLHAAAAAAAGGSLSRFGREQQMQPAPQAIPRATPASARRSGPPPPMAPSTSVFQMGRLPRTYSNGRPRGQE